jgi:uncharacterized protein CbrC (UPF0167 family)
MSSLESAGLGVEAASRTPTFRSGMGVEHWLGTCVDCCAQHGLVLEARCN